MSAHLPFVVDDVVCSHPRVIVPESWSRDVRKMGAKGATRIVFYPILSSRIPLRVKILYLFCLHQSENQILPADVQLALNVSIHQIDSIRLNIFLVVHTGFELFFLFLNVLYIDYGEATAFHQGTLTAMHY